MTVVVAVASGAFFVSAAFCQAPKAHFIYEGAMPPGAIGSVRLARGGPLCGYFQPVEIKLPEGTSFSMAEGGTFGEAGTTSPNVGLLIGSVYRLRVINIPFQEGVEVFPTIELIDRVYPPRGKELAFPIPIQITEEDLRLAAAGKFVTRVIYVEDPLSPQASVNAIPEEQTWFDVAPGSDPLIEADALGRPVAILRLGGRVPERGGPLDPRFLYGCPPFQQFAAVTTSQPVETTERPVVREQARRPEHDVRVLSRPPQVMR